MDWLRAHGVAASKARTFMRSSGCKSIDNIALYLRFQLPPLQFANDDGIDDEMRVQLGVTGRAAHRIISDLNIASAPCVTPVAAAHGIPTANSNVSARGLKELPLLPGRHARLYIRCQQDCGQPVQLLDLFRRREDHHGHLGGSVSLQCLQWCIQHRAHCATLQEHPVLCTANSGRRQSSHDNYCVDNNCVDVTHAHECVHTLIEDASIWKISSIDRRCFFHRSKMHLPLPLLA